MSKTITMSDDVYEFIKRTAHELETRNNRHTHTPIFRIYEKQKIERRDGCGDHMARLHHEGAEEHWCKTCKEIWEESDWGEAKLPQSVRRAAIAAHSMTRTGHTTSSSCQLLVAMTASRS